MTKRKKRAPSHLGEAGKKFWFSILGEFDFEQPHHFEILEQSCGCCDRIDSARKAIAKDGEFVKNRFGEVREHPALATERQFKTTLLRCLRELGLDLADEGNRARRLY